MSVIRCPHGHYYDDSRFSNCPHCGITVGKEAPQKDQGQPEGKKRFWRWMDHEKTVALSRRPDIDDGKTVARRPEMDDGKTVALSRKSDVIPGERKEAETDTDSKTVALESVVADDDQKTVSYYSGAKGNDYVTGWLVCTAGPEKGRDYRLHHGFNRIGRDMDMDVQVMDDPAITRKNHCSVVYDETTYRFSVVAGSGTLTYWNDQLLDGAQTLQAGDEIRMGNSSFIFIPFCKEGRIWEREDEA